MPRGVFCIETVWLEDRDQTSVRPMLQFLRDFHLQVPFIHRTALTMKELNFNLERWLEIEQEPEYPILYLSFHGRVGQLELEDDSRIGFGDVGAYLAERCENRVVHFASCGTLNLDTAEAHNFLQETGASAVSGYAEPCVDWIQSMALDLMYLELMQYDDDQELTPYIMQNCRVTLMNERPYVGLRRHLRFKLHVAAQ